MRLMMHPRVIFEGVIDAPRPELENAVGLRSPTDATAKAVGFDRDWILHIGGNLKKIPAIVNHLGRSVAIHRRVTHPNRQGVRRHRCARDKSTEKQLFHAAIIALLLPLMVFGQVRIPGPGGKAPAGGGSPNNHLRIDTLTADATWTDPAGITSVDIELWGAGGGGSTAVGGGGGGAYSFCDNVSVTPTTGYTVQVGVSAANTTGEDSTFDTSTCVAKGGLSGAAGGTGGAAASGTGTTKFSGGNGRVFTGGSGGGGGAGTAANGSNTSTSTGGAGGNYSGGVGSNDSTSVARAFAAGGGSGAAAQFAGFRGHARISYLLDVGAGFPVIESFAMSRNIGTSHTINLPTCASGKLYIIAFSTDGNPGTTESGGTLVVEGNFSTNVRGEVYRLTSTGSDTFSITTDASEESTAIAYCVAGAGGNPEAGTPVTGNGTANSDPPSVTYSGGAGNNLFMAFRMADLSATDIDVSAAPSGYSDFLFLSPVTHNAGADIAAATKHSTSATDDPGAFTSGAEQWVAHTIVIPGT